jgi:hypothetical protein
MDLRDIQRLHEQFATHPVTIDLAAQIAALPAPSKAGNVQVLAVRSRWKRAEPVARRCAIAGALAGAVAVAGIGSGALYRAHLNDESGARKMVDAMAMPKLAARPTVLPRHAITDAGGDKEIDATPARTLGGSMLLNSSEFAGRAPPALTADEFRQSVARQQFSSVAPAVVRQISATERAMSSPVQSSDSLSTRRGAQAPQPEHAVPMPVPQVSVQTVPKQAGFAQPVAAALASDAHGVGDTTMPAKTNPAAIYVAPATAANGAASAPVKSAQLQRRHISKAHVNEAGPASDEQPGKPSAPSRAGGNEVQLF